MHLVFILVFGFVAFIKLSYLFSRLTEPRKSIIHIDTVKHDDEEKDRYWVEIEFVTREKDRIKILNINPSQIIDSSDEQEMLKTAIVCFS